MRYLALVFALAACSRAEGQPPAPSSHVDCAQIAVTLTSLELGNYATPDQREPREQELLHTCRAASLSDADAQCILDATKDTLAFCPHPLSVAHAEHPRVVPFEGNGLPTECHTYLATMQSFASCANLPAEARAAVRDAVQQAAQAWRQAATTPETVHAIEVACEQANVAMRDSMRQMQCQ